MVLAEGITDISHTKFELYDNSRNSDKCRNDF